MRTLILVLAGAALPLASTQSAASNEMSHSHSAAQPKAHNHHTTGFVKPGAAVTLSHDYDGKTGVGELETISATLSHIYQDGALSVALLSAPDIQISAFTPIQNTPVYTGSTLDLPIQFSSQSHGYFPLSLEVVYTSSGGQESRRVLSIPVNIGGNIPEKILASNGTEVRTNTKSGVIGLPAFEVIE